MGVKMSDELFELMKELFDENEIRPREQLETFIKEGKCFIETTYQNDVIESIIVYFKLQDYIFIDYLGINPKFHGQGLGTKVMNEFLAKQNKMVLLEVEKVDNEIKQRRVYFYERLGLHLNTQDYEMLSYIDHTPLPMKIMSYPTLLTNEEFDNYVKKIKRDIYLMG